MPTDYSVVSRGCQSAFLDPLAGNQEDRWLELVPKRPNGVDQPRRGIQFLQGESRWAANAQTSKRQYSVEESRCKMGKMDSQSGR